MVATELTKGQKEAIKQKFILRRQRKTVLPLWYHLACILFIVGISIGAGYLYRVRGLRDDIVGRIDVQVLLGIAATLVMAGITAYAVRKHFPEKYLGMLTYWLGSHIYLSVLVVVLVLLHADFVLVGELFNFILMSTFWLVIGTGFFGFLVYKLVAKLLARIEGEGKLIEDIVDQRRALNLEILELTAAGSGQFKTLVRQRFVPAIVTFRFLMRQYIRREPIQGLCEDAQRKHKTEIESVKPEEQSNVVRVIENLVTARRLDAEYLLHRLLGSWLPSHVAFTVALWLLIVAHIVIVLYY